MCLILLLLYISKRHVGDVNGYEEKYKTKLNSKSDRRRQHYKKKPSASSQWMAWWIHQCTRQKFTIPEPLSGHRFQLSQMSVGYKGSLNNTKHNFFPLHISILGFKLYIICLQGQTNVFFEGASVINFSLLIKCKKYFIYSVESSTLTGKKIVMKPFIAADDSCLLLFLLLKEIGLASNVLSQILHPCIQYSLPLFPMCLSTATARKVIIVPLNWKTEMNVERDYCIKW